MLTTTLRSMLAHKLRLLLTTASIALGIAFLAGTFIIGDTTNAAFDKLFANVSSGTDTVVRQEAAFSESSGVGTSRAPIDAAVLKQVQGVDGVEVAEGASSGYALLTDNDGKAILTTGAPTMGYSMPADESLRGDVNLLSGEAPVNRHETAIDATSAEENDIALGSTITVLLRDSEQEFTVVGTVGYGTEKDLGGSTAAYFDSATAQRIVGTPGTYSEIDAKASDGVSDTELAERLDAVVPDGTEAVTGQTVSDEASAAVKEDLKILNVMLGVFAAVALFVGGFIIWNTFTMIVTQRSREIALMRAIGATRGQVLRSLVVEAFLLGVGASAIGLVAGYGVAKGLTALMGVIGFSLPSTTTQILPRTIIVSLVVGTLVTLVAALVPAWRATKVLPVEALREANPGADDPSWKRGVVGSVFIALGIAGVLSTLYGDQPFRTFGLGVAAAAVGVIVVSPLLARPLASVIGGALRWRGVPAELAEQNAKRNPRRTASTATALMIGLALVVGMGVFASSLKASFGDLLDDSTNADLYVSPSSSQADGFSPTVLPAVAAVPGVETLSPTGYGEARFGGVSTSYSSVDPATVGELLNLDITSGSAADLGTDGVLLSKKVADEQGLAVGDTLPSVFAATGKHDLTVSGIYASTGGFTDGDYVLSLDGQNEYAGAQLLSAGLIKIASDADIDAVQADIKSALADHPDAKVLTQQEFQQELGGMINGLLALVIVMLLLAVVIALLGIVNTLALSVFERTRELGLLRAVGMTAGQVRAMVRWESVIISMIGALIGAGLGIGLGIALAQALKDEGIKAISVPVPQIALYVVAAALAGVLAAIGPARSASRVDVLRAVVTD